MADPIPNLNDPLPELKKLRALKAGPIIDRAAEIRAFIKALEEELSNLRPVLTAKMEAAGVQSFEHQGVPFVYKTGYDRRTFDTGWAKKTLVAKGVSTTEIEKRHKVTWIPPTVQIGGREKKEGGEG